MMKKLFGKSQRREKGSVIVFFAISLVTLLAFVSLAVDIGMVNMKRAAMMDLCQQMRKARLDAREYIMHAKDPALMIYEISNQCAIDNGFQGGLKVYYREHTDPVSPTSDWVDRRTYDVRIELYQEYKYAFAAAFFTGSNPRKIAVYLDGGEQKTATSGVEGQTEPLPVWHPGVKHTQTGSYQRQDFNGLLKPDFTLGDCPADWTSGP